jgi:hypothetical protein
MWQFATLLIARLVTYAHECAATYNDTLTLARQFNWRVSSMHNVRAFYPMASGQNGKLWARTFNEGNVSLPTDNILCMTRPNPI